MSRLIADTLLLGAADRKKPGFVRVDLGVRLADFVARRAEMGDAIHAETPAAAVIADIAPPELKRVLDSLVDNALRHAGCGSTTVSWLGPETVTIDVVDAGAGVPTAFIAEMSSPLTRIEGARSRDTGGAGLGLAIAKALLPQIGGALNLSNLDQGGFRARVTLAVAPSVQRRADG